jgi:hypothetical protein
MLVLRRTGHIAGRLAAKNHGGLVNSASELRLFAFLAVRSETSGVLIEFLIADIDM